MSEISFEHVLAHHYTVFDGLGGMHIEDIYQDGHGWLWVATADGGVSRFDSARFDSFGLEDGLPNLTVMSIAEDADGRVLFGTFGGGIAAYDGRSFEPLYTTEHGLPSDEVLALQPQPDGVLVALTGAGVAWFEQGRCTRHITEIGGQPLGRVYDMATDAAGTTWLATWERGLLSLDGRSMTPEGEKIQHPWKFARTASGQLWIAFLYGTPDTLIGYYDPHDERLALIPVECEIGHGAQNGVRHVRVDQRGWLWLARRGVIVRDDQGWHHLSVALPDVDFSGTRLTYEDREGNVWIGLWGGGLIFSDPFSLRSYVEADGLPDCEVVRLGEDHEGRLWLGTMGGMACMEAGRIRTLAASEPVSALVVDGAGQVWSGGPAGWMYRWDDQVPNMIAVAEEIPDERVAGLHVDERGQVWLSTFEGRFGRIEDGRFIPIDAWAGVECRALLRDQNGALWLGFFGKVPALYRYKDGQFHPATMAEADTIAYVHVLWEHQNSLWVGTAKGLFVFDLASEQVRHFTTRNSGLLANGILALTADAQGHVWIGTSGGGVLRYDGENFHSIRLGGSPLGNVVEAVLCDGQGRLWFGTRAGLVAYRPGTIPPRLVLREVFAGHLLDAPEEVSCSEGLPEIRIHFQGISFRTGGGQVRYRHRLVGHAPAAAWSGLSAANVVAYKALPAGDYRFEVQAVDRDGLESAVLSLAVHVHPDVQSDRIRGLAQATLPTTKRVVQSHSPAMKQVMEKVAMVADADVNVLVTGETGTGKGLLAQIIHEASTRRDHSFIHVNCGALSSSLIESELFGHEKGAFTGAGTRRLGRFELAAGGTLFLDEIGNLPFESQPVLLQVLEDKRVTRVGGGQPVPVDVRVVAATNQNLPQAIGEGRFRSDLFYRLNTFPITLPPLRQRREDIPALAEQFVEHYARHLNRPVPLLGDEAVAHLQAYSWPGNVRELEHLIQQAILVCAGGVIRPGDILLPAEEPVLGVEVKDEKQQIMEALQAAGGRIYGKQGAAALLGMNPERLRSRMRVHGLAKPKKRSAN